MLEKLSELTIGNPIFISVLILIIWFLPGVLLRRMAEKRYLEKKNAAQAKKISSLYPKDIT